MKKLGTMDRILILIGVVLVAYIVVDMIVFCKTGDEPSTLTGCVFAACSAEGGFMAVIMRTKIKSGNGDKDEQEGEEGNGRV